MKHHIIRKKHQVENHLTSLIEHCLKNTYLTYNGQKHDKRKKRQWDHCYHPSASIFIADFETRALDTARVLKTSWMDILELNKINVNIVKLNKTSQKTRNVYYCTNLTELYKSSSKEDPTDEVLSSG
ncbi:hypothetical protein Trydic_g912 [Trypoxylus dichotomus]